MQSKFIDIIEVYNDSGEIIESFSVTESFIKSGHLDSFTLITFHPSQLMKNATQPI